MQFNRKSQRVLALVIATPAKLSIVVTFIGYVAMVVGIGIALLAVLCMSLGWYATKTAGILDRPGPDVPKRGRVPTAQGIVIVMTVMLIVALWRPGDLSMTWGEPFTGLWLGVFLLTIITGLDEYGRNYNRNIRIPPLIRLAAQGACGIIAYLASGAGITEIFMPGGLHIVLSPLTASILTIGWYRLFINAINRFDGIYGLASGMSSIGFASIRLLLEVVVLQVYDTISADRLALLEAIQRYSIVFFIVSLLAAIMEFRPRGVIRDTGTMVFGFVLGYLALLGGAKIGTVIVVLLLPVFDSIRVILDRLIRRKKSPFKGDYTHLHHRLLALGRNRTEARVTIRTFSVVLMILMLLQGGDRTGKLIIFIMMAALFFSINRYIFRKKKLPGEYVREGGRGNAKKDL